MLFKKSNIDNFYFLLLSSELGNWQLLQFSSRTIVLHSPLSSGEMGSTSGEIVALDFKSSQLGILWRFAINDIS